MEKTQKLSLEDPDPETGFQAVKDPKEGETENSEIPPVSDTGFEILSAEGLTEEFELSESFWEAISSRPSFKKGIDILVTRKFEAKLQEELPSIREKSKEEGFEEGKKLGMAEGRTQMKKDFEALEAKIEQVTGQLMEKQYQILHAHERQWSGALVYLLRRFLSGRDNITEEQLRNWLRERLEAFGKEQKVSIYLSDEEFERLENGLPKIEEKNWIFRSDPSLSMGEIRCETNVGGIFFSPEEEFKKLEEWLADYFPEDTKEAG